MTAFLKILYVVYSPILAVVYWRNTMRSLDDVHAGFDLQYGD